MTGLSKIELNLLRVIQSYIIRKLTVIWLLASGL